MIQNRILRFKGSGQPVLVMMGILLFSIFSIAIFHKSIVVAAAPPTIITYQGKLLEDGLSVTTTQGIAFLIYDQVTNGSLLYTASGTLLATSTVSVTPSSGIFSVNLGGTGTNSLAPSIFANNTNLFLEIWIEGAKMTPRKRLTAAPYAVSARYLMGVTAATVSTSAYIPIANATGNFTFSGNPQTTGVGGGVVYINPAAADANETLFGVALNGTQKLRLDEDGDLYVTGSVNVTGTLQVSATSTLNNLLLMGDVVGLASTDLDDTTDLVRIAAPNVFTAPNTFNATTTMRSPLVVSTTIVTGNILHLRNNGTTMFVVDKSGNVGINTSTPATALAVSGKLLVTSTSTLQNVTLEDLVVTGDTSGISFTDLDDVANVALLNANQTFTKQNIFSATTTLVTTTINGRLNVDGGTLFVNPTNNRVGINSSSPQQSFVVNGRSIFTATSSFVNGLATIGNYDEGILDFVLLDIGSSAPGGRGGVLRLLGNSTNKPTFTLSDGTNAGVLLEQVNGEAALFLGSNNYYGRFQLNDYTDSTFLSFSATSTADSYILGDFLIGSDTEAITTASFSLSGDDGYVHDLLGVGDSLYVENAIHVGTSSLHLSGAVSGGLISMTNGPLTINSVNDPLRINTLNNKTVLFGSGFSGFNTSSPQFQLAVGGTFGASSTSTFRGVTVNGALTVNGTVSGISSGDLDDGSDIATLSGTQSFTGAKTFSATTTLATTSVTGQLSVGTGFVVNPTNGRVGISSSSPQFNLGVDGTVGITGTTTLDGYINGRGRVTDPVLVSSFVEPASVFGVDVAGDYAYVAARSLGLYVVNVADHTAPVTIATNTPNNEAYDVTVAGGYAYVSYAGAGLRIFDVSNPKEPILLGTYAAGGSTMGAALSGSYAYIADQLSDFEVVNVSNPTKPVQVDSQSLNGFATEVAVSGRYAYVGTNNFAGGGNTFFVIDINNPVSVAVVGQMNAADIDGFFVSGNYAYAANGAGGLRSIDISDPTAPSSLDTLALAGTARDVFVSGNYAYISNDNGSLQIVDVSDPSNLVLVTTTSFGGGNGRKVVVSGNYAYIAGEGGGVRIVDVAGASISNVDIGTANISNLQVSAFAQLLNGLEVRNGLQVGSGGLLVNGDLAVYSNTSTLTVTNTIRFSHTTLFETSASTSDNYGFVFNTKNAFAVTSTNYILSIRNAGTRLFSVATNGDVHASGDLFAASATVGTSTNPGDLAERVDVAPEEFIEPGDVLIVDPDETDRYRRSSFAYAAEVAGVVSTNPTITIGKGKTESTAVMAMVGRVPVKVSAENGPIRRGDLLVTASIAGYAMRYDPTRDDGLRTVSIVGVALEPLEEGTGKRMALIRTGWINNRHQTIAEIQHNLIDIAEASGVALAQDPAELNVVEQVNGQIGEVQENLNLNGYYIVNVAALFGKDDRWQIDEDGRFITQVATSDGSTSLYALQSRETEYIFSGSGELNNGTARVDFDEVTRDIIDPEESIKVTITLTEQAKGVYVTEKDVLGFRVNELDNGNSNATFDWLVIARRKLSEDELPVGEPEAPVEEVEDAEPGGEAGGQQEVVVEEVQEEAEVVPEPDQPVVENQVEAPEAAVVEEPIVEQPAEEPPANEAPIEAPPQPEENPEQ